MQRLENIKLIKNTDQSLSIVRPLGHKCMSEYIVGKNTILI